MIQALGCGELWRPIVRYEGYYEVSNWGRVKSLSRTVRVDRPKIVPEMIMKPSMHTTGRRMVTLRKDGTVKSLRVHRLVLEAFVGPCPPGMSHACHYDDNPLNNLPFNLRWGSNSDNMLDSVRNGTHINSSKTHCAHGHEFTPDNTYRSTSKPNARICKTCTRQRRNKSRGIA